MWIRITKIKTDKSWLSSFIKRFPKFKVKLNYSYYILKIIKIYKYLIINFSDQNN
jgi:hypothetical protein